MNICLRVYTRIITYIYIYTCMSFWSTNVQPQKTALSLCCTCLARQHVDRQQTGYDLVFRLGKAENCLNLIQIIRLYTFLS